MSARPTRTRAARHAFQGAVLGLALGLPAAPAGAADVVFTVANYPVEASADNAVAAKDKALSDGQQAAFRSLLKRLVPVTAYPRVRRLATAKAANFIEGVSVRSERNSTTDYIASLDFSFQAQAVRDLLRREGIPFTDEQAPVLTLVPVWRAAPGAAPKDEAAWTNVWKGLDLEHALSPVKLQTLRKEVNPGTINALASGDGSAIRALAAEYRSERVLLAIAEPDVATKRLNVTLAGRDAVGGFTLFRAYRVDPADPGYANELAAVVALRILEGRWKALKARAGTQGAGDAELQIQVEFRGMGEWQDISRRLSATPGVNELEVLGLSARGARVTLRYEEGAEQLAEELAQQGLSLRNAGGAWVLQLR
jgi:hypothetical protein